MSRSTHSKTLSTHALPAVEKAIAPVTWSAQAAAGWYAQQGLRSWGQIACKQTKGHAFRGLQKSPAERARRGVLCLPGCFAFQRLAGAYKTEVHADHKVRRVKRCIEQAQTLSRRTRD